jgi:hypothetical protein
MSLRLLEVDDLFHLEQIGRYFGGAFSFSPEGKVLAYVTKTMEIAAAIVLFNKNNQIEC